MRISTCDSYANLQKISTFASSSPPLPITKTYVDSVLAYFTEQEPLMDPME